MIAYLNGPVAELEPAFVVVDCHGIGYKAWISLTTYTKIRGQEKVKILTHLHIREDAQVLYGFADRDELRIFEHLISVSGVGCNTAVAILSSSLPREVAGYIAQGDASSLKRIKGIGEKTAARIVLELKDKIGDLAYGTAASGGGQNAALSEKKQEALAALTALGFPKAVMEKRIAEILKAEGTAMPVEQLIKMALRNP